MLGKKYLAFYLCAVLTALILCIIILSCVPPVSRDALTHHLAVPKLYLQHGGIYEIPNMKFSYYPMNLELLYMIPMYFGNDIIPKFIHFTFAFFTSLIIYCYLKTKLNNRYGLFGALLFLSTPIIVKLSITAYVDLGLVFFSTAALILLLKWSDNDYKLTYLLCSASCCGFALGIKYNGLVALLLLALLVPIIYIRRDNESYKTERWSLLNQIKAVGYGFIFIGIALVIFSPWMIRNYIWKKNPIYPLYHSIISDNGKFNHEQNRENKITSRIEYYLTKSQNKRWNHFLIRRMIYKETRWEIALVPIRIFFHGEDGKPKYFDGKLNPLLLILPLAGFVLARKESVPFTRHLYILCAFSILFLLYTFIVQDMRMRYITPILPPLVIVAAFGFKKINDCISCKWHGIRQLFYKQFLYTLIIMLMLLNLRYLVDQFKYVQPFDYICGKVDRAEYISKFRPEYPVIQYANLHIPKTSRILGIFLGNRRYYSDRDMIFNEKLFIQSIQSKKSGREVFDRLKKASITHIIIWEKYFIQWVNINFSEEELNTLKTFFNKYTKKIYSSDGYMLFQLVEPTNARIPLQKNRYSKQ